MSFARKRLAWGTYLVSGCVQQWISTDIHCWRRDLVAQGGLDHQRILVVSRYNGVQRTIDRLKQGARRVAAGLHLKKQGARVARGKCLLIPFCVVLLDPCQDWKETTETWPHRDIRSPQHLPMLFSMKPLILSMSQRRPCASRDPPPRAHPNRGRPSLPACVPVFTAGTHAREARHTSGSWAVQNLWTTPDSSGHCPWPQLRGFAGPRCCTKKPRGATAHPATCKI